jgi:sugar (pentulose or hexulose) kinase
MSKVLTFDLGTTYFKVCLFDDAAQLVGSRRIPAPVERPASGRAELPAAAFRDSLIEASLEVSRKAGGLRDVTRICFASQANTFTLMDERNEALLPFLLWTDERARGLESALAPLIGHPDFFSITGIPTLDHLFLPAKIRWLHQFEPALMSKTRRLCCMGDYFVWWLTGNHLTEAGLTGLTGLIDIHRLQYWSEALRQLDLPIEWLPKIVRAGRDAGRLRSEIVIQLGLDEKCRLVMGCLDQYAGAIGAENVACGGISATIGTVLATVHCTGTPSVRLRPLVFQGPSFAEGVYYEMVFSELSAGVLERYRNGLPDRPAFEELDDMAAAVPAGAEGLRLSPDAALRKSGEMFMNRSAIHHRGHEVRAILEAVAAELRRQAMLLCGERRPQSLRAAGGGANSKLWLRIMSDVLGCQVESVDCPEPTSLGAAKLALGQCTFQVQAKKKRYAQ